MKKHLLLVSIFINIFLISLFTFFIDKKHEIKENKKWSISPKLKNPFGTMLKVRGVISYKKYERRYGAPEYMFIKVTEINGSKLQKSVTIEMPVEKELIEKNGQMVTLIGYEDVVSFGIPYNFSEYFDDSPQGYEYNLINVFRRVNDPAQGVAKPFRYYY